MTIHCVIDVNNVNNKESMKNTEIAKILEWHNSGTLKTDEAVDKILSLFSIVGQSELLFCDKTRIMKKRWTIEVSQNDWEYIGTVTITAIKAEQINDTTVLADGIEIKFDEEIILITHNN